VALDRVAGPGRWLAGERRRRPCGLRLGRTEPPVGWLAGPVVARTVCCQQSHPAHIVVGAGIFWRTSAHKRSPVFRRWARRRIPL